MNTKERDMLTRLLQQMSMTEVAQKDMAADCLIREACLKQPDAAYLLVHQVMLLDLALQQSQAQLACLQRELDQLRDQAHRDSRGYFPDPNAWGNSVLSRSTFTPQAQINPASPPPVLTPVLPPSTATPAGAWSSGMLGSMATTAAGVVAGGLLFQGIERLRASRGADSRLMDGPGGLVASEPQGATAFVPTVDDCETNADLLDASSVDDFFASEIDRDI